MRKLTKILKNKKGFTLVEAIAVVAIMGILVSVLIVGCYPFFGKRVQGP